MVENKIQQIDLIFHALADNTRRQLLQKIATEPSSVSELAKPFNMSLNAISKHLKVLEQANLLNRYKNGREYYFKINQKPLEQAIGVIAQLKANWEQRLDALENYFKTIRRK